MSPAERATEENRAKQAGISQQRADTADRRTDIADRRADDQARRTDAILSGKALTPNAAGVQGRFNQREIDAAQKRQDDLQVKEQEQHKLRQNIGTALATDDGATWKPIATPGIVLSTISAPVPASMSASHRQYLQNNLDAATKKAQSFADQQKGIRQRFGWGEFAPGGEGEDAPPAAAAPAAIPATKVAPATPQATPAAPKAAAPAQQAPKADEVRYKGGQPYKFDGKQWKLQATK